MRRIQNRMALKLTITSFHRHTPGQVIEKTLLDERLTIGRAADNDWVLEDPERVVSSHHCYLDARGGQYTLTDTSTNGVFVNDSPTRVARDSRVPLRDGDRLRMGKFELTVQVTVPSQSATAETDHALPELEIDLPPAVDAPRVASGSPQQPFAPPWGESLTARSEPSSARSESAPAAAIPDDYDPLAASWHGAPPPVEVHAPPDPVQPDHTPPEQAHFRPPPPREEAIPTNWEAGSDESDTDEPDTEEQRVPPQLAPEDSPAVARPAPSPARAGSGSIAGTDPAPARRPQTDALAAFVRGLGCADLRIRADPDPAMEEVGLLFRLMVQGTMEILMARSQVKSEFRVAQTVIRPAENNPLKFSLSVDDALDKLLAHRGSAHLPPERAVREAFDDIKAHQLAVVAGMQAAIKHLLRRFDPKQLSARLGEQGVFENLLPAGRKARMWDRFNLLYEEIASEAEDDFQELFGKEFARAYEEYVRKI
jgi:type VI secretion system protein